MINDYGYDINIYNNSIDQTYNLLSKFLNGGHLGLFLGAGASKAIRLPDWNEFVISICTKELSPFDSTKSYTNADLKELISRVKDKYDEDEDEYLKIVKTHLYNKVKFNFKLAKKDLLIALSSLMVGSQRGTIKNVVSLNFDSVLEWYLSILGLSVNVITKTQLLQTAADVNITHIHGFLPYDASYGENTTIIFSSQDFENRLVSDYDYWKDYYIEFFRRHIFLSIGVSAASLLQDVRPYLHNLDEWYHHQGIKRLQPYGIAFLSKDTDDAQRDKLAKMGIISHRFKHTGVPEAVFKVVQKAAKDVSPKPSASIRASL